MKRLMCVGLITIAAGCATGNKQPMITQAGIIPSQLHPGDTAMITVQMDDPFDVVQRVEGTVKEDTTYTFEFNDIGELGDVQADDDIWTCEVDVPFDAPPGEFEFHVMAYDSDGQRVLVNDESGNVVALTSNFQLAITVPEPPADTGPATAEE